MAQAETSEPQAAPNQFSDQCRADRIRSLIFSLSSEIGEAQKSGLKVTLNISTMATPHWCGYRDAVKISRDY